MNLILRRGTQKNFYPETLVPTLIELSVEANAFSNGVTAYDSCNIEFNLDNI